MTLDLSFFFAFSDSDEKRKYLLKHQNGSGTIQS